MGAGGTGLGAGSLGAGLGSGFGLGAGGLGAGFGSGLGACNLRTSLMVESSFWGLLLTRRSHCGSPRLPSN
ncbi:MAG TPA: hypothetical protein DEU93_10585 [Chitinophagaceae bacterium]|nr:hypothetical protein [Chitinophagaceae bacterium]